tara:strand:- start:348 stop:1748 length:1401 start_codon:yes stop_codon:yes gene_type:complete
MSSNNKISIVIRTKNEEEYIGHCLDAVFNQDIRDFEVIIVDNASTDQTLDIAKKYTIKEIINIDVFKPGNALNIGIEASSGDIIVMLSAHCIPKTNEWLKNLVSNFVHENIAGVYGRQLPVSYSKPNDVKDLYITFGVEKRIQKKDYFFHNANSAIRKSVWLKIPFDDDTSNIEDRIWAKKVIEKKYQLIYEPEAPVFHHHGIHQNQNISRSQSTINVLKDVENFNYTDFLPKSLKPEQRDIIVMIPIINKITKLSNVDPIDLLLEELSKSNLITKTYIISDESFFNSNNLSNYENIELLASPNENFEQGNYSSKVNAMIWGLNSINKIGLFPDYVIYLDPLYFFRPINFIKNLIYEACYKGLDTVFYGYTENQSVWIKNSNDSFQEFGEVTLPSSKNRYKIKTPFYRALVGIGCITRSRIIRTGQMINTENIGIIPTDNIANTLTISDKNSIPLIKCLLDNDKNK